MPRFAARIPLVLFLAVSAVCGETVKDREGAVRRDKAKMEDNARWIYSDIDKGFAEAKKSGKPLMVVLRCVPCLACMGLDTQVLLENEELTPLMDQFVRVRLINANALDLSRFQFDYDLSFTTMFFNADGTIYGRYGSWNHQKNPQNKATHTFKHALEKALEIHSGYPANKKSLAGKQGTPSRFKTPVDMPRLQEKYQRELNWEGKVVQSCVHCHMIGDSIRKDYRDRNIPVPNKWIYPFPSPDTIGLRMSGQEPVRVEALDENSPAAEAGIKAGDLLISLDRQSLISTADINWALHNSPDSGVLPFLVERKGEEVSGEIHLHPAWRTQSDISRRVGTWPMRAMAFGGMRMEEITDEERKDLGMAPGKMALRIKHVGQYGIHGSAKRAGFKKGDILIEVDGHTGKVSESALIGKLIREFKAGEEVPATIIRSGERKTLAIPLQ